jgi:hypothetical protein
MAKKTQRRIGKKLKRNGLKKELFNTKNGQRISGQDKSSTQLAMYEWKII